MPAARRLAADAAAAAGWENFTTSGSGTCSSVRFLHCVCTFCKGPDAADNPATKDLWVPLQPVPEGTGQGAAAGPQSLGTLN